ncbi:HTH domain protein [Methylomusa anaerophila]|uniref:HTH domain protein n=2 Tax=Methylomusa anaerophila TaxID=1930071 RepID=A0A348AF16_9FIRM|nr:HTH domain protein [Methylomusa anaerophila]
MYLLNRDVVSSRILAEKFEVSHRTIQRDIEALNLAGIPVLSIKGSHGGYGIVEGFKMDKQITNTDDYLFIITALKGLCSAYDSKRLNTTLEKLLSLSSPQQGLKQKVYLDFSVLRENSDINNWVKLVEKAIDTGRAVEFAYTNADHHTSHRLAEPLALTYKWYTWYMFGYCCKKKAYRLFRLSRIGNLCITDNPFSVEHRNAEELMAEQERRDNRSYIDIKLLCKKESRVMAVEHFPVSHMSELGNGDIVIEIRVPENERMWFASLMSFGDKITVLEPDGLIARLNEKAQEIINLYKK